MATPRRCLRCAQKLPPERQYVQGASVGGNRYCSRRCLLLAAGLPATFDARQPGEVELGADRLLAATPKPWEVR